MSDQTKKIVVPPFLLRRLEAFRIVKGDAQSYLLRDKIHGKTYDFDLWQFFVLEALPTCETVEKLQSVFADRFDRTITKADLDELFGSIADRRLFDEAASGHPLLAPFMHRSFEVAEGKAKPKLFTGAEASARPGPPVAAPPPPAEPPPNPQPEELPAGIQDALGLDWKTTENMIGLFDPKPMLRLLAPVLRPLYYLIYAVPLLLIAALFLVFGYSEILLLDLEAVKVDVSLFEHLLFVFVTVHIVTTMTAAVVADYYKVSVDSWGVYLTFGFMPRWVLKMTGADRLTRHQTMWLHGATLIARVMMFSVGALLWYATRDAHTTLTETGLLFVFSCGIGLLFESGNPLIKANGYYLLAAFLNEPHLRGKAYAALLNKFKGGVYKAAESNMLALYALLSATYVVFVILLVGYVIAKFVLGDFALGGSAVIITVAFAGYMFYRNYQGLKKFGETFERQVQFDRWRNRTLPVEAVDSETAKRRASYWKRALLICFVLALFLPYSYEPSGNFTIFPVRRAAISSDTPGLVTKVFFDGGEAVKQGTVLAQLAHDDWLAQIKVLDADIEEQKHVIANLKTLPKPETVKVAEQQLEVARSQVPFSRDKVQRLEKIYPTGAITLEELENAKKEADLDKMQVVEKEAALALAKTGPTKEEVASAEAKLVSLQEQRSGIGAKIDRTTLRMPFDGNILSLHLMDKVNSYLGQGVPFAEVENTGFVTAQIDVIESDIQYIRIGQSVRARASSYFNDEFEGKVTLIDRNVTPKSFGNVVKVIATFENKDALLRTGMAGQAKVASISMPVWQAFTHSIIRFIRLQVWAWIP